MTDVYLYVEKADVNMPLLEAQLQAAGWTEGFQTAVIDGKQWCVFAVAEDAPALEEKEQFLRALVSQHDASQQSDSQKASAERGAVLARALIPDEYPADVRPLVEAIEALKEALRLSGTL